MKTYVGINGACGRMGQRLFCLALRDPALAVSAAVEAPDHPDQGRDAGEVAGADRLGVPLTPGLPRHARLDVLIDFSLPAGTMAILPECVTRRTPIVIATTGHSHEQRREIEAAAHETAVLYAPNTSLGVNILLSLVKRAAELLRGRGFDVEIVERHHRNKRDSPSGAALHLAAAVQEKYGEMSLRHGRSGDTGERPAREIGIHSLRMGDCLGEHTVVFAAAGEAIELSQRAISRECYVRGALQAAKFIVGKPPGRYSMADVLGL
jgi:4-hydroxy-tetrahydrodipicolinate reductase